MKIFKILFKTLLITPFFLNSAWAENEIIFAYENKEVYPYFIGDTIEVPSSKPGTSVEIIKMIAKDLNIKIKFVRYPWKRCLSLLKKGKVAAVFDASFNLERMQYASYPKMNSENLPDRNQRMASLSYAFYKNIKNDFSWDGHQVQDSKKKSIGAVLGYSIVKDLKKMNLSVKEFKTGEKALSVLELNQISAYADLKTKVDYALAANKTGYSHIKQIGPPIKTKDYYLIFSKKFRNKNKKLTTKIWESIEKLRSKGDIEKIEKNIMKKKLSI